MIAPVTGRCPFCGEVHEMGDARTPEDCKRHQRPVDKIFDPNSKRRDAKGNIIPWAEEHDYFMGFDPNNPDVPTD